MQPRKNLCPAESLPCDSSWKDSPVHIARQTPQELVIVTRTRWVAAICAAGFLITLYLAITRQEPKNLFLSGFFPLFILVMDARKTFTFDAMQRIVRWSGRSLFKAESGEIPFDDITDIGTQETRAGNERPNGVPVYRLTIVTPRATI